jgi:hypothetical protein|nr:T9SS type A sorting domain-containing protein [uncultured Flavobacterium sp.]
MKKNLLLFIVFVSINIYSHNNSIVLDPLSTNCLITGISCNGSKDGSIIISSTGGQAPYTYAINGGAYQSNTILNSLSPGIYLISTKDALGNTTELVVNLAEPAILIATTAITKSIDCINGATVTVTATGGSGPYFYSKDGGITFFGSNTLTNLSAGTYPISVKDSNGCTTSNNFIRIVPLNPLVVTTSKDDIRCKGDNTGSISVIATGGQTPYTYSLENNVGIPITNNQSSNIFSNLSAGTYNVTIKDAFNCVFQTMPIYILEPATPLLAIVESKDQIITLNASGGSGEIRYAISPNLNIFTTNNTFTNLTSGIYDVIVQDQNGCFILFSENKINPSAPLVDGKNSTTFDFTSGQTLADIKINIPNIKWYIKASGSTNKTSKIAETALPLTTVLVDNTTYYASQTINGIESKERLAVTTKLSTLGTPDFDITNLSFYPNPVKNVLTISNTSIIDEVTFISIKGETLLSKKINDHRSEIDLSNFSNGVYFLKIKSEGAEKTVKLIKE